MQSEPTLSFPDDSISHLFAPQEDIAVHRERLEAALLYTQMRNTIDQDRVKLKSFSPKAFHRSTKKKTFTSSVENAVAGKTESLVLMPLLQAAGPNVKVPPLDLFILACFSLTSSHYTQLNANGLVQIFPRLFSTTFDSVQFSSDMRTIFLNIIKKTCHGSDQGMQILQAAGLSLESQTVASDELMPALELRPNGIPASISGFDSFTPYFEYRGIDIETVDVVLAQVCSSIRTSRQWLWERSQDSPGNSPQITSCITAHIPDDRSKDMWFVVRVGWDQGWKIINEHSFNFCSAYPTQI